MDAALVGAVIDRDWPALSAQVARLGLGSPDRAGMEIRILARPAGADEDYLAVLECDGYDAIAPLLDFADPQDPTQRGRRFWPRMAAAPMNSVTVGDRPVPIICTPGTRGYHIHASHHAETHPRSTWRLAAVATLLHRFLNQMGPYQGRGL
jgi:hypothetical protein